MSSEATALATLYRNAGAYPPPAQEQLQDVLRDYTESVIQEAWPEQHKGGFPSVASKESIDFRRS